MADRPSDRPTNRLTDQLSILHHSTKLLFQASSYDGDKLAAQQEESVSCLLQMDFSENFTIAHQDEIQSAHWAQQQVTVYTINLWSRDKKNPWVICSDTREHEKNTVAAFTNQVLDWVSCEWSHVEVVSISGALSLSLVILMKVLFPSQVVLWKFFP